MNASDRAEFVRVLTGLAQVKPGKPLTPEALDMWWLSMRQWEISDFKAAAAELNRSIEFMPSAYHFEQLKRAGRPTEGAAWAAVLRRCVLWRQLPRGRDNDLIDRVAAQVGGYERIAMADTETALPHIERRFKEAYREQQEVEEVRQALPNIAPRPRIEGGSMRPLLEGVSAPRQPTDDEITGAINAR